MTKIFTLAVCVTIILFGGSCAPKYGCPANGKNAGAERILSGEKIPKAKKFKS